MNSLSGNTLELLTIDSVIFFLAFLGALIYIFKNTLPYEKKWFILYTIFSFSSMNIFIKPVQDNLIVTPRTFIFYYKFFEIISPLDILFLVLFIVVLFDVYKHKRNYISFVVRNDIFSIIFKRDLLLYFVSIIGFAFFYISDGPCNVKDQLRSLRLLLCFIVMFYFFRVVADKYNSITDIRRVIVSLSVLNFINLMNQAVSCYFISDITWQRNGLSVCFLDQTDIWICVSTVPFLLKKPFSIPKKIVFFFIVETILFFLIYIKTFYILIGLTILIYGFISISKGKIEKKIAFLLLIALFGMIYFIGNIKNQTSIATRAGQTTMLFNTYSSYPSAIIFGIGDGGMIRHQEETEDGGEIRAIDIEEKSSNYTTAFQVPVLSILKKAGVVGIVLTLVFMFFILQKCIKIVHNLFLSTISIYFFVCTFMGSVFIGTDPQMCLFLCEAALLFTLVSKNEKIQLYYCSNV